MNEIIENFEENPSQNINPFSMALNGDLYLVFTDTPTGVIDAAVNGGVAKYHELFLNPDYVVQYPGSN